VNVQHGWWFPEKPPPRYGVWESNANVLTNNGPPYDPAMGTYQLRALLCKIYPVSPGDREDAETPSQQEKDDKGDLVIEFDQ
jgi:hypothetical protein